MQKIKWCFFAGAKVVISIEMREGVVEKIFLAVNLKIP